LTVLCSRDDVITSRDCYLTCIHRVHHQQTLKAGGYPEIRAALCTGGESNQTMVDTYNRRGLHCIVATPGRLNDHLNKKRINMDICKYFVLDEGDRMLDLGFDEEVRSACVGVNCAVVCCCVVCCCALGLLCCYDAVW
jgi:hypothetical protein